MGGRAHTLIYLKMCPLEKNSLLAAGGQGSGKSVLVAFLARAILRSVGLVVGPLSAAPGHCPAKTKRQGQLSHCCQML